MQVERDLWVALAKVSDRARQRITRLRVGGGDRQATVGLLREFFAGALQVVGIVEHALDDGHDQFAYFGERGQPLARAHEEVDAQLFF